MAHHESGWQPKDDVDTFRGFEVNDHGVFPSEINVGETDGDVDLTD